MAEVRLSTLLNNECATVREIQLHGLLRYKLQLIGILVDSIVEVFCRRKGTMVLVLGGKFKIAISTQVAEALIVEPRSSSC